MLYNDDGSSEAWPPATWAWTKPWRLTGEFQLGMELHAKYTVFAEGARGSLGRQLIAKFKLDEDSDPQTYGLKSRNCGRLTRPATNPALCCTPPVGR